MAPLNVADYGMAGIAVAAIAYVSVNIVKLFTANSKATPQETRQVSRDTHSDKLIELVVHAVDNNAKAIDNNTQSNRDLQNVIQQNCTSVQVLASSQRWDMVEDILKHTVREDISWTECLGALKDLFKEVRK